MRIRAKKNSFEEPRYTTAQKPQSTVASFRTWQGLKEFSCIGPELIERVYTERRGFGLQSCTSCALLTPRLRSLTRTSCALSLALLGATYVSNPQQGSCTERRGFEPLVPFGTQPFQDCTLNRSDISPRFEKKGFHVEAFKSFCKNTWVGAARRSLRFESQNGVERREGDSNPRILADQRFSRPPESTALASLQAFYSRYLTVRD